MKNIVGDILQRPALGGATIALMDIDPQPPGELRDRGQEDRFELAVPARVETHLDRRAALEGADFVVVAFQIGGYDPCTVTDFEVPKKYGLGTRSPIRSASAASCARCAPCRISGRSART